MKASSFNLQARLVTYAVAIIRLSETLPRKAAGRHICDQILRSGTSPAPNYGEAQSAESRNDFTHKLKIALKELRETYVWLQILQQSGIASSPAALEPLIGETNELIAIFATCIKTTMARQGLESDMGTEEP